jgi:uncharacterized membrane protein YcaP (DUF421 family)
LDLFLGTANDTIRIVITAVLFYFLLVLILRISGKRTLSSMNAFDFVVTVAIGTTLSSTILDSSIALTDGLTAFVVLVGLQFAISWFSSRSQRIDRIVKSEPKLLCYNGAFLFDALKRERIVESEIMQSLRSQGFSSLKDVNAVVLETNGNISIISELKDDKSALKEVKLP